ncbi:MAG: hypothetical protein IV298_03475 [Cylindrospermopsis raciborskii KL1]|jgi:hypothetical protein|uniref:hypothetical protein n=1 Tax=Cylindrospermopsis raciborskii TaxID=77022 RepID=UPI001A25BD99|nr:hypothetical protein [Cylindrospermopsis raciborskii]MBG0742541.1 hypothetical protein [Cylindrospermopsis raciborskii KL1]
MSIINLIQELIYKRQNPGLGKNPELEAVREKHNNLPKSKYFDQTNVSEEEFIHDLTESVDRATKLGLVFRAAIEEHYTTEERNKVLEVILRCISYLAENCRIFPDVDYEDVWYTDYYDLIQLAEDMGLGDYTLPHWPEEKNISRRYLELSVSDLVQIFLAFLEESIIEEYSFKNNTADFVSYLFRETLKTRRRVKRQKDKQNQSIPFLRDIPNKK